MIILRQKIRPFQFSSLILFLILFYHPAIYSRQQLATDFSSVSNFCSNICFLFLLRFYSVSNFRNGNGRFYFPFLYRHFLVVISRFTDRLKPFFLLPSRGRTRPGGMRNVMKPSHPSNNILRNLQSLLA